MRKVWIITETEVFNRDGAEDCTVNSYFTYGQMARKRFEEIRKEFENSRKPNSNIPSFTFTVNGVDKFTCYNADSVHTCQLSCVKVDIDDIV